jgi:hypothetical protein
MLFILLVSRQECSMKDAFDLWWEWANKTPASMLMIDGDIHYAIGAIAGRSARPREGQRSCAPVSGKP